MHFIKFSQNTFFTDMFEFFCIIQVHAKLKSENSKRYTKQVILHTNLEILDYSDISVGSLPRNSSTLSTPIGHWYWSYLSKACRDLLHDWSYSLKSLITNMEDTMAYARTANLQCNLKTVSLRAYIQRDMFIKLKQISSGLMPDIYLFYFLLVPKTWKPSIVLWNWKKKHVPKELINRRNVPISIKSSMH